jgi:hypothetical protein
MTSPKKSEISQVLDDFRAHLANIPPREDEEAVLQWVDKLREILALRDELTKQE